MHKKIVKPLIHRLFHVWISACLSAAVEQRACATLCLRRCYTSRLVSCVARTTNKTIATKGCRWTDFGVVKVLKFLTTDGHLQLGCWFPLEKMCSSIRCIASFISTVRFQWNHSNNVILGRLSLFTVDLKHLYAINVVICCTGRLLCVFSHETWDKIRVLCQYMTPPTRYWVGVRIVVASELMSLGVIG